MCEPQFERPLKDISLGQVLLRLFQTSRRFNVEIQPQLVLLQKTLLNVEGLGRQLDPDLDLWNTAKPFLERWMKEQVGTQGLSDRLREEAPQIASWLPDLPRLLYRRLSDENGGGQAQLLRELLHETRRTHQFLKGLLLAGVGFLAGAGLMHWWLLR